MSFHPFYNKIFWVSNFVKPILISQVEVKQNKNKKVTFFWNKNNGFVMLIHFMCVYMHRTISICILL